MTLISVVSAKGGQGKSSLSNAIALACEGAIVTNERDCDLISVLEEGRVMRIDSEADLPKFNSDLLVVYDGAKGLEQKSTVQAIERADHVLIPVKLDGDGAEEIKRMAWSLKQINLKEASVVVMANVEKDFLELKQIVEKNFPRVNVFWIPRSVCISKMNQDGVSLVDRSKEKGSEAARLRRVVIPHFEALLKHIQLIK